MWIVPLLIKSACIMRTKQDFAKTTACQIMERLLNLVNIVAKEETDCNYYKRCKQTAKTLRRLARENARIGS